MKKIAVFLAVIIALFVLMFSEYRYIMTHQCPYYGENNTLYIEIFGQIDSYCME